jgi:hypothetical protein
MFAAMADLRPRLAVATEHPAANIPGNLDSNIQRNRHLFQTTLGAIVADYIWCF